MLDGAAARKTHTESKKGAVIDSIADIVFIVVTAIKLFKPLFKIFPQQSLTAFILIALIRISAYIIGIIKFHRPAFLHTVLNKITGFVLFITPYFLFIIDANILAAVLCIISGLSSLEDLACEIKAKKYDPDIKTIL